MVDFSGQRASRSVHVVKRDPPDYRPQGIILDHSATKREQARKFQLRTLQREFRVFDILLDGRLVRFWFF